MNIGKKKNMTTGEMEASASNLFVTFVKDVTGKGPADIRVFMVEDMVLTRMSGVLNSGEKFVAAEDHFSDTVERVKKNKVSIFESGRPILENGLRKITGRKVKSFYVDISTVYDEMIVAMTLERRR